MNSAEELANVPISTKNGQTVLLREVADITPAAVVGEYDRYNMQRMVSLTGNVSNEDLGTAAARIQSAMAKVPPPPPRVNVAVRGQVAPMEQIFGSLQSGLLVAVAII